MIIGNGMLATAFAAFDDVDDIVIFASGTANSLETDRFAFDREFRLLHHVRRQYPDALLVYFSTCSIADPGRVDTLYVQHKIAVERQLLKSDHPQLVFRLPVVIGESNLARTLPFYIRDRIVSGQRLEVWERAVRYPMDIDDVVRICTSLIDDVAMHNRCIDVALRGYEVPRIVRELERVLRRKADKEIVDCGNDYAIDLRIAHRLADSLGIAYDDGYLARLLQKYFSPQPVMMAAELRMDAGETR